MSSRSLPLMLVDFSMSFYEKKDIKESLLALQDEFSCNVLVVLWLLWLDYCLVELNVDQHLDGASLVEDLSAQLLNDIRRNRYKVMQVDYLNVRKSVIKKQLLAAEIECELAILDVLQNYTENQEGFSFQRKASNVSRCHNSLCAYMGRQREKLKDKFLNNHALELRFLALFETLMNVEL